MVYLFHRYHENVPDGKKMRFLRFLYIIYFAHMIQCYFYIIFFILFILNDLHVFSRCNIMIFNTLTYLTFLNTANLLKNANFHRCFIILHRFQNVNKS